jgi:hypothetical protein
MASFVFITSSGPPNQAESQAQRHQIRRQAMRDVAIARRQRGTYGQHNLRQYPVFYPNSEEGRVQAAFPQQESYEDGNADVTPDMLWKVLPSLSAQGYERARIDRGFDILSLSALTSVHITGATVQTLSSDPERLRALLQEREVSWLDFIPLQYSQSDLLQVAVDCTLAQAQRLLCPNSAATESTVLRLYGNALFKLQAALSDKDRWSRPDVLCATQILAIYEV